MAFPRTGLPWIAPLALAGLFASWTTLRPREAAAAGYFAGVLFFALSLRWFGETAGALLGPYGFLLDIGPAFIEASAFALAAGIAATAARYQRGLWVPVLGAAGFTLAELLRSSGVLGAPLYQIGAAFVETPLAPLAAFGGVYALTFVVALAGAALGALINARERRWSAVRVLIGISVAVVCATTAGWLAWPARTLGPATLRVAAVQGNIRQTVKWRPDALAVAVDRYVTLTATVRPFHPQFVLWPETVITTDLRLDAVLTANPLNAQIVAEGRELRARFAALAASLNTALAVGSIDATTNGPFNALFFFGRSGSLDDVYRKEQLVPFAEFLPGPPWLRRLPFADLISDFAGGTNSTPIGARLRVAPLICWEADFTDLAHAQVAAGARFFAVATDDAWFGASDGPYAQAQLAQLRAIETGRWIVRAAATGISGIIAPDGRWQHSLPLETSGVVRGTIGEPQPTLYGRLGPLPVACLLALLLLAGAFSAMGRERA